MQTRILHTTLLAALALTACEPSTAPSLDDPVEGETVEFSPVTYNSELKIGSATLLTGSASDTWPQLEGDWVAWYRSAPVDQQGLWVQNLGGGDATRVWTGQILGTFDLRSGQVFFGGPAGLYRYDTGTGSLVTLDDAFANYRDVEASAGYVTGTNRDNADRPFWYERATGEMQRVLTPTAVPATRGSGTGLVWSDFRESGSIAEIFHLDIPTGTETKVTDEDVFLSSANAWYDGDRVVYFDSRFCPGSLRLADLSAGTNVAIDLGSVGCPVVVDFEGDVVVWREARGGGMIGLGFVDLAAGISEAIELPNPGNWRIDADLDGLRAVHTSRDGLVLLELSDPPEPPFADAGGPYEVSEGVRLLLDGTGSYSFNEAALSFSWDMGDGTVVDGTDAPGHAWADNGSYTVTVTVSEEGPGGEPLVSTDEAEVTVVNTAPVVHLEVASASFLAAEAPTTTASFSDAGAADGPWSWTLSTEAGAELGSGSAEAQGALPGVELSSLEPGTHVLVLSVTDKDEGTGDIRVEVEVLEPAPEPEPAEPEPRLPEALRIHVGSDEHGSIPNAGSNGIVHVIVFGQELLGVPDMDVASIRFGPTGAAPLQGDGHGPRSWDVDLDGMDDLKIRFRASQLGLSGSETELCLTLATLEGEEISGCAPVKIAGSGKKGGTGNGKKD